MIRESKSTSSTIPPKHNRIGSAVKAGRSSKTHRSDFIRDGDWKLVREGGDGEWELYDLANDRSEQRDLAKERPAQAKKLAAMWEDWATRAQVKLAANESKPKKKKKAAKE